MAKRSGGVRDSTVGRVTMVTTGDGNLAACAACWGTGADPPFRIASPASGRLVGLWAATACGPASSDWANPKVPTPNPASIRTSPAALLMANPPNIVAPDLKTNPTKCDRRYNLSDDRSSRTCDHRLE